MQGDVKLPYNVQFMPSLVHNLLSVGHLMTSGYPLALDDGSCVISDKKSSQTTETVRMTQNYMFPFDVSNVVSIVVKRNNEANLWHLRCGHLNVNGLKLLSKKWLLACRKLANLIFVREVFMRSKIGGHFLLENHGELLCTD